MPSQRDIYIPDSDQIVAVNSDMNITFTCVVTVRMASALLVINDGQISRDAVPHFEDNGVFTSFKKSTSAAITITKEGKDVFQGSLHLQCAAFLSGPLSQMLFGPQVSVSTYGK